MRKTSSDKMIFLRMVENRIKPNDISFILFGDYTGKDTYREQMDYIMEILGFNWSERTEVLQYSYGNK